MLFRLHDNTFIIVNDEALSLSVYLVSQMEDIRPTGLILTALKKLFTKKTKKLFIEVLTECTELESEAIKALHDPGSPLSLELRKKCAEHPESVALLEILNYVQLHVDRIFERLVHILKFLKDDMTRLILEFLQIPCKERSESMFGNLPFLVQRDPKNTDLKSVVDPEFHLYIDFIRKISFEQLMELSRATSLMGVRPLNELIGTRISQIICEHSEKEIRAKFEIQDKYRDAVNDKLHSLLKEQAWVTFAASSAMAVD